MDDSRLRSIVESEINDAVGYLSSGSIANDRKKGLEYYEGRPFGNEIDGRSEAVSTDVQDVVESLMADFMEIFAGGDEVVEFEPTGPEDEQWAKQATDYVTHLWMKENRGFGTIHDWIKDALLQKNGIIKVYWEEKDHTKRHTVEGLSTVQFNEMRQEEGVEILEYEERPSEYTEDGVVHDATYTYTEPKGKPRIEGVPPEEFGIARRSDDLYTADFTYHRTKKTITELIEMGFDRDLVESIPTGEEQEFTDERVTRYLNEDFILGDANRGLDASMREVWIYECYIMVDYDDDGLAEMRAVTVGGSGYTLLQNEAVDEHPFCSLTPIRMPHRFFGRSVAELVMDIQYIKSTVLRQLLDNMYFMNNQSVAVNENVNLDDLLVRRPGGIVRVEGQLPPNANLQVLENQSLGPHAYPLLEFLDGMRETRTGVTRYNQGLDADSLNKTATGIAQILGRAQKRTALIARVFAETGFKHGYQKTLKLIINHQDRKEVIRLRGKWVEMDPKHWNADMDLTVKVGLGHGSREQETLTYRTLLEIQQIIVQFQGGASGPLVTLENLYNTLKRLIVPMGLKNVEPYFSDPADSPPQPPQPNPEVIKEQAKAQEAQAKLQIEAQKDQLDARKDEHKAALERDKAIQKSQLEEQIAAGELDIKRQEAGTALRIKRDEADLRLEIEAAVAAERLQIEREKAGLAVEVEQAKLDLKKKEIDQNTDLQRTDLETRTAERKEAQKSKESKEKKEKPNGKDKTPPINLSVNVDARERDSDKVVTVNRGKDGKITGANVSK